MIDHHCSVSRMSLLVFLFLSESRDSVASRACDAFTSFRLENKGGDGSKGWRVARRFMYDGAIV